MSSAKKLFETPSSSGCKKPKNRDDHNLSNGDVSGKKQKKINSSKKITKSLTDEEYEDIFMAVLRQPVEDAEKSEDSENGIEEQNVHINVNLNEELDQHASALRTAQMFNEATPPVSDIEDKSLKLPPSPIKKKKRLVHKESVSRKQLSYPNKEKQQITKNPELCSKKKREKKTLKDRLLQLQLQRAHDNDGTWVQCCRPECNKWRYLEYVKEPFQIPSEWYCDMNRDPERNSCDKPEADYSKLQFVFTKFAAGSLVWAKLHGYPWWPAMVDDDPAVGEYFWTNGFSDIPTHYNVVFLDDVVSRAWIPKSCIKPFKEEDVHSMLDSKNAKYLKSLEFAVKNATAANNLALEDRLTKYSFATKYTGKWPKEARFNLDYCGNSTKKGNKMGNRSTKGIMPSLQKQMANNEFHYNDLSDAEEILNQLEELDDLESITSLLNFDSESEEDFIPPSQYHTTAKSKKPAKLNKRKQEKMKQFHSSQESIPDNQKKPKRPQIKSSWKKQIDVHNSEKVSKKVPLSNCTQTSVNKRYNPKMKCVKRPKFSVARKDQIENKTTTLITNSKDINTEPESISQILNDSVDERSQDSVNKNSKTEKISLSKGHHLNSSEQTNKCQMQEITKGKRKPSFCPPKVSKTNSTTESDLQRKESMPKSEYKEMNDLKEKCDITSSPVFEDSPSESQKSAPFETEE